jgi:hypothetical protein
LELAAPLQMGLLGHDVDAALEVRFDRGGSELAVASVEFSFRLRDSAFIPAPLPASVEEEPAENEEIARTVAAGDLLFSELVQWAREVSNGASGEPF